MVNNNLNIKALIMRLSNKINEEVSMQLSVCQDLCLGPLLFCSELAGHSRGSSKLVAYWNFCILITWSSFDSVHVLKEKHESKF